MSGLEERARCIEDFDHTCCAECTDKMNTETSNGDVKAITHLLTDARLLGKAWRGETSIG